LTGAALTGAALTGAARRGDQEALAELYRRAWPRALAAVRTSCGWDEAEDAVAVGFVRALDRLSQIHDPTAVEAWLTRSAIRASIDLARRRRRAQPWGAPADLPQTGKQHAESAAERALARLDRAALASLVQQLPNELGRLIRLRYVAGLSVQEVSAAVGLPEGTVRRRCFDAYRLLRQRFLQQQLRSGAGECATVTDQLCRAASRNVSTRARRRIEQHLGHCRGCRERQAELAETVAELSHGH
jgi:NitT/TauT family transport system substrate-binding protein